MGIALPEIYASNLNSAGLRKAFSTYPSGVTSVCGLGAHGPIGIAASSFTSVSLDPPLVSVCMALTSKTWPALKALPRLGVSVLAAGQGDVARRLAAKDGDRFAEVSWEATATGAVFVSGSALWLECGLDATYPAGDHQIALFHVYSVTSWPDVHPLVFHGSKFRQLEPLQSSA